jgi:hypothetical protein
MIKLGHAEPPDPNSPGMFALASSGRLAELLESAGLTDVVVDGVELPRTHANLDDFLAETLDLSGMFRRGYEVLSDAQQAEVRAQIRSLAEPFTASDGTLTFPGRTLVASASA